MADVISFIGSTLGLVASPRIAAADVSAYNAKTYVDIGKIVSIGALGDTSQAISISLLKEGRVIYVNGEKTLGEISVTLAVDISDTAQATVRNNANTNTNYWFEVEDLDGKRYFFQGLLANYQELERSASQYKGATFVIRGNTGIVVA
jgi:Ethanolamine utilization protein EutJ (predicted chaperonin)